MSQDGRKSLSPEIYAGLTVTVVAVLWRWLLAWQPIDQLLVLTVSDDMFYYLKLASHWVSGQGVSFDGLGQTNGFHPLFLLLCAAIIKLGFSQIAVVHILLTLSSGFGLVTALLIAALVRKTTGDSFLSLLAFALYALNPYAISLELNGLETALYGMFLAASLLAYLHLRSAERPNYWHWAGFGALVGCTLLSRTEGIFLPLIIMVDVVILLIRGKYQFSHFKAAAIAGAVTLLLLAPWITWNLVEFGSVAQDSGKIFPLRARLIFEQNLGRSPGLLDYAASAARSLAWNVYILGNMLAGVPYTAPKRIIIFFLVLPAVVLGFLLGRFRWQGGPLRNLLQPFGVGAAYILFMFAYYTFYHRASHWRYFYSMLIVLIPLALTLLYGFQLSAWRQSRLRFAVLSLVALYLSAAAYVLIIRQHSYPHQIQMLQAARWMKSNLPEDARVGAFNAGIYGYWSGRQVVNLDGVVNNEILEVFQQQRLGEYVQEKGIDYLVDYQSAIANYFKFFDHSEYLLPAEPLFVLGDPAEDPSRKIVVYRLSETE